MRFCFSLSFLLFLIFFNFFFLLCKNLKRRPRNLSYFFMHFYGRNLIMQFYCIISFLLCICIYIIFSSRLIEKISFFFFPPWILFQATSFVLKIDIFSRKVWFLYNSKKNKKYKIRSNFSVSQMSSWIGFSIYIFLMWPFKLNSYEIY